MVADVTTNSLIKKDLLKTGRHHAYIQLTCISIFTLLLPTSHFTLNSLNKQSMLRLTTFYIVASLGEGYVAFQWSDLIPHWEYTLSIRLAHSPHQRGHS